MKPSTSKETKQASVSQLDFNLGDPLATWMTRRHWSAVQLAIAAYAWALFTSFGIALAADTLFPRPGVRALLNDGFYFISETVTIFVVCIYYGWLCNSPKQVLLKLESAGILRIQKTNLMAAQRFLASKIPVLISALASVLVGGLYFYQYNGYATTLWYNTQPIFVAIRSILVIIPVAYVGCSVIARSIVNTLVFRETLRNVDVNPMHPDRAGGLLPLGQYALKSTYVIAVAGVLAALAEFSLYQRGLFFTFHYFHVLILAYIIIAPLSFFAPLGTARNAMLDAKNQLLLKISKQFTADFSAAYKELESAGNELKATIDKVEQLQRIQALTIAFPVWPFDVVTLRQFSITVSSPFITIALSILTRLLTDALTKAR